LISQHSQILRLEGRGSSIRHPVGHLVRWSPQLIAVGLPQQLKTLFRIHLGIYCKSTKMAKVLLRSVLQLGLLLDTVKGIEALHPTPVTVGQLDLRANPEPTPRAILEDNSEIVGRSYYNTLCGYADANSRKR
jgi:hypothetical protein